VGQRFAQTDSIDLVKRTHSLSPNAPRESLETVIGTGGRGPTQVAHSNVNGTPPTMDAYRTNHVC
jgi:hypothetical protein